MTPVNILAEQLRAVGMSQEVTMPLAAQLLKTLRKTYGIVPLTPPQVVTDTLRLRGFTEAGALKMYDIVAGAGIWT